MTALDGWFVKQRAWAQFALFISAGVLVVCVVVPVGEQLLGLDFSGKDLIAPVLTTIGLTSGLAIRMQVRFRAAVSPHRTQSAPSSKTH